MSKKSKFSYLSWCLSSHKIATLFLAGLLASSINTAALAAVNSPDLPQSKTALLFMQRVLI
jgi:hypothetical protein